jgi:ATP-dependent Clp protease adaptor protein ClpS
MSEIQEDRGVEVKDREDLKEPPKYAVIFINDDYTTMDFVIEMLQKYFGHSMEEATFIMLDVHEKGKGVAGVYTRDIAETKAAQCNVEAKAAQHPLKVIIEEE